MSRVIITDKYSLKDFMPSRLNTPIIHKSSYPLVSSPKSRAISITRHIKAALEYTTSHDLYLQKTQAILSVASKEKDLKSYLNENSLEKENPRFLHQKINHIAKIVNANGEKDEEIYSGIKHRLYERKNQSLSMIENDSFDKSMKRENSKEITKKSSEILLQKRYNQILYSENYIERLKDRYQKHREKNEDLQKNLSDMIKKHWEELLREKEKKAKKKIGEISRILDGDEEEIMAMRNTKAGFRMKRRLEKEHRKRYMSLWNGHGLPAIGIAYEMKRNKKKEGNLL